MRGAGGPGAGGRGCGLRGTIVANRGPAVGETVRERARLVRGGGTGGGWGLAAATGDLWRKDGSEEGSFAVDSGHCSLLSLSKGLQRPRIRFGGFNFGREGRFRSLSFMKLSTCSLALTGTSWNRAMELGRVIFQDLATESLKHNTSCRRI